ncbi:MAG: hypothetical protein FWF29_12695 [Treponema sp.]|nr:hypothetical protein [Treponema sp.]
MNNFLQKLPLNDIARFSGAPPKDAVAFSGYPRQHPSDKSKLVLVCDPLGSHPLILEFKLEDILFVEETHQAVTESGEGILMVKLWVRKGSHGMILEPFEVTEHIQFKEKSQAIRDRFLKNYPRQSAHH